MKRSSSGDASDFASTGLDDAAAAEATPQQFLTKDGDCEDYAITKFYSLLTLGFSNDQMRVVVLNDLNLRVAHAVLVVYVDGVAWLLDNQIRDVVLADAVRHYRAIYSVNETTWWLHRY